MADLSKIKLPSGSEYNLKDAQARNDIQNLQNAMTGQVSLIGTTTTAITDQATTNPITINGNSVTAIAGNMVYYNRKEFIFDGSKWIELGDLSSLGSLAYKNEATGSVTAAGNVSKPNFIGQESSVTITATESNTGTISFGGTVGVPQFTGAEMTSTGTFAATGNVTITQEATGTNNFTPAGTVAAPTISIANVGTTTTVNSPTAKTVASAVTVAAPSSTSHPDNNLVYYSVSGETLSLYQIGYSTTSSITDNSVTVKTGDASYTANAPKFTGTPTVISASFTGTNKTVSVKGTTAGSNSAPTFTPKKYNISGTTTAAGEVSKPVFSGTATSVTVS